MIPEAAGNNRLEILIRQEIHLQAWLPEIAPKFPFLNDTRKEYGPLVPNIRTVQLPTA